MTTLPVPNLISRSLLRYGSFLIALVASAALSAHAQNLVLNPGFETGDFTDWTIRGSGYFVGQGAPHSGRYSAVLGGSGLLDQPITTVVGQSYQVSFWLSNFNPFGSMPNNFFTVSFAGVTILDLRNSPTFGYTHFSGAVTATSTSSDLSFAFYHVMHIGFPHWNLDDVSVTAAPALQLYSVFSPKTHGGAGTFNIYFLPLGGVPGVECRSGGAGGNHTFVFTFTNNVVSGNATVTSGIGTVSGPPMFSYSTMTVNLTGVADVQRIIVTLTGVTDSFGQVLPDTAVSADMLIGDTTGNRTVNSSDIAQVKAQAGLPVDATNFREDVTVDGVINASDIGLVKSKSGDSLPP